MSYLASREGGTVLLGPSFSSLHPRWWESSTVKWRKEEIRAKIGDGVLRSQASTYEHFDTWQDLTNKWEFKPAPVLAGFIFSEFSYLLLQTYPFFFLYLKKIINPESGSVSLSSSYPSLLRPSLHIMDGWGLRSVAGVQEVIVGQSLWKGSKF